MATESQLLAFKDLKKVLSQRQAEVAVFVFEKLDYGATLREIADALGHELSSVSGRVNELVKLQWLKDSLKKRVNPRSRKYMTVWVLNYQRQWGA